MNIKESLIYFSGLSRIEQFLPAVREYYGEGFKYARIELSDEVYEVGSSVDLGESDYFYEGKVDFRLFLHGSVDAEEKEVLDLICDVVLSNLAVISKLSKVSYRGWKSNKGRSAFVSKSECMKTCLEKAEMVAPHGTTVLLQGETGVGKEVLAKHIHSLSDRKGKAFRTVNCAALPHSLIDSALFGHVKGAFSGASEDREGFFAKAEGGTLFLDEIGELPLETQSRLLRVLEYGDYLPLGSDEVKKANVRIIAASHKSVKEAVLRGEFRQDLYFRLSIFPIVIPSLRERKEDLPALIDDLLAEHYRIMKIPRKTLSSKFFEKAMTYSWPGNVRELKNTLEKSLILSKGSKLQLVLDENDFLFTSPIKAFDDEVKAIIEKALLQCGGKVDGGGGAAELLQLKAQTLYSKMRKYGIGKK